MAPLPLAPLFGSGAVPVLRQLLGPGLATKSIKSLLPLLRPLVTEPQAQWLVPPGGATGRVRLGDAATAACSVTLWRRSEFLVAFSDLCCQDGVSLRIESHLYGPDTVTATLACARASSHGDGSRGDLSAPVRAVLRPADDPTRRSRFHPTVLDSGCSFRVQLIAQRCAGSCGLVAVVAASGHTGHSPTLMIPGTVVSFDSMFFPHDPRVQSAVAAMSLRGDSVSRMHVSVEQTVSALRSMDAAGVVGTPCPVDAGAVHVLDASQHAAPPLAVKHKYGEGHIARFVLGYRVRCLEESLRCPHVLDVPRTPLQLAWAHQQLHQLTGGAAVAAPPTGAAVTTSCNTCGGTVVLLAGHRTGCASIESAVAVLGLPGRHVGPCRQVYTHQVLSSTKHEVLDTLHSRGSGDLPQPRHRLTPEQRKLRVLRHRLGLLQQHLVPQGLVTFLFPAGNLLCIVFHHPALLHEAPHNSGLWSGDGAYKMLANGLANTMLWHLEELMPGCWRYLFRAVVLFVQPPPDFLEQLSRDGSNLVQPRVGAGAWNPQPFQVAAGIAAAMRLMLDKRGMRVGVDARGRCSYVSAFQVSCLRCAGGR
jgi:hypothetical protein